MGEGEKTYHLEFYNFFTADLKWQKDYVLNT